MEEIIEYTPLEVLENYKKYFDKQIGQKILVVIKLFFVVS